MELTMLLAILSPIAALIFGLIAMRRNQKSDDAAFGREIGEIKTELKQVHQAIDSIWAKIYKHEENLSNQNGRISVNERTLTTCEDRIDILAKTMLDRK